MENKYGLVFLLVFWCFGAYDVTAQAGISNAFDKQFYEDFIDDELCDQQVAFLLNNSLHTPFLDATSKIPSGILRGNLNDLGDYHQCIGIRYDDVNIHGKYCAMVLPFEQDWPSIPDWNNITWPEIPGNITLPNITLPNITLPEIPDEISLPHKFPRISLRTAQAAKQINMYQEVSQRYVGGANRNSRVFPSLVYIGEGLTVAICIPKVCSSQRGLKLTQQNFPTNLTAREHFCRLPGDKPFVPGDYVAIVIFTLIGLLNLMSTTYDLVTKFYLKRDSAERSTLLCSFSVYTNTRRLLTFSSGPGQLDCIDGIRALSMMWVVVGHTFAFTLLGFVHNIFDIVEFMQSFEATWVTSSPIVVDTFFALTGILVVYTCIGKLSRAHFFRGIHMFYLNRLLRMFPLLATMVLFQATLAHHIADGPYWLNVAHAVQNCRTWWWSALLHVQNYVNPLQVCVVQSWYLSVDTQLYFISPLVLWFLWGQRRTAWAVLMIFLLLSLASSSIISFMFNFSAAVGNVSRLPQFNDYVQMYYFNTLTRAPPFFVGMIYGYMLHVYREKKIRISKVNVIVLWLLALLMMAFCIFSIYPVMRPDHSAQAFDNFLNAYMRAFWAVALGWLIFACVMGYGGPVNWFLSLRMWKLPARLSFAMYLLHAPSIMLVNGTWVKTHYFSVGETMYRYFSDLTMAFVAAFIVCLTIDAPFSTLQKLIFGGGRKRPPKSRVEPTVTDEHNYKVKTTL